MLELWGLGDVALAIPFVRAVSASLPVTLVAKPHAAALLQRFAPAVEHLSFEAPWTAFRGKYRLHQWRWRELATLRRELRARRFDYGVSARPDPRDHALLWLAGVKQRLGFARAGSAMLLNRALPPPSLRHRAEHWATLLRSLASDLPALSRAEAEKSPGHGRNAASTRRLVIHTGAGQRVRMWPRDRFEALAVRLRNAGWGVHVIDDAASVDDLIRVLSSANRFIGNDSGPGHIAALLRIPTFTIFGPQLPELFAPQHPQARWIEGTPCAYKPCFDRCRFAEPHCLLGVSIDAVWAGVRAWLAEADRVTTQ